MPNGIIIIDKPQEWTSMDVCAKLRRIFGERRVGHAGTLDPMATGVLPVFVGRATRAVEFAERGSKVYETVLRLGQVTDTQDVTGTVLEEHPVMVGRKELEEVLPRFTGEILQVPPMYSALKINGQKLCNLARKGKTIERPARPITIFELDVLEQLNDTDYRMRVRCSKGTYIRTLCHDIGMALGCGGTMAELRRTEAAGFALAQSVTMEQLLEAKEQGREQGLLLEVDAYFSNYPECRISGEAERRCRNGNSFPSAGEDGMFRVYGEAGEFLMLGQRNGGTMTTVKSFFAPPEQKGS